MAIPYFIIRMHCLLVVWMHREVIGYDLHNRVFDKARDVKFNPLARHGRIDEMP
jgi:hypothetical protein